jgi:signal transduction histidine kinase
LTGGIGHDLNNILAAILGSGQLAQSQAPEERALHRYLDDIMQAAGRARSPADRILGFSQSGIAEQVSVDVQRERGYEPVGFQSSLRRPWRAVCIGRPHKAPAARG